MKNHVKNMVFSGFPSFADSWKKGVLQNSKSAKSKVLKSATF